MISNSQIKQNAKTQLKGNLGLLIGIIIVYGTIYSAASGTGIGGILVGGPLLLGLYGHLLNVKRNGKGEFGDLFNGFKNFGKAMLTELLVELYTALWSMLFLIPGIIKSYSYALSVFILHDNPNIGANEAITLSRKMMDGNKGKLFVLQLSFIGWHLLGILTFGILELVYVQPYEYLAIANFYDEVKAEYENVNGIKSTATQNGQGASTGAANFCEKCGAKLEPGAKFCSVCGVTVAANSDGPVCKNCGAKMEEGTAFCTVCGNKVNQ